MRIASRKAALVGLASAALLANSTVVMSHSGGTDENGCHAGTEPYHCHNDDGDDGGGTSSRDVAVLVVGTVVVVGIIWYWNADGSQIAQLDNNIDDDRDRISPQITITGDTDNPTASVGFEYRF